MHPSRIVKRLGLLLAPLALATAAVAANPESIISAAQVGIDARTASVAGATGAEVESLLASVFQAVELRTNCATTRALWAEASASLLIAEKELAEKPGDPSLLAIRDAKESDVASARTARDSADVALFQFATSSLHPEVVARLSIAAGNAARRVPTEFIVLTRSPEEWSVIETAIRAESRAVRTGTELADEHAALLAGLRQDPAVVAAVARLDAAGETVEAAFAVTE